MVPDPPGLPRNGLCTDRAPVIGGDKRCVDGLSTTAVIRIFETIYTVHLVTLWLAIRNWRPRVTIVENVLARDFFMRVWCHRKAAVAESLIIIENIARNQSSGCLNPAESRPVGSTLDCTLWLWPSRNTVMITFDVLEVNAWVLDEVDTDLVSSAWDLVKNILLGCLTAESIITNRYDTVLDWTIPHLLTLVGVWLVINVSVRVNWQPVRGFLHVLA